VTKIAQVLCGSQIIEVPPCTTRLLHHAMCCQGTFTTLFGVMASTVIFSSIGCLPCLMAIVSVNSGRTGTTHYTMCRAILKYIGLK